MPDLQSDARLQQTLSLALEQRSPGYVNLVASSNAILAMLKENDCFEAFSGPTIRERLQFDELGTYVRYAGYRPLVTAPKELFGDAEFLPKMAAISIQLSNEEILKNSGANQLKPLLKSYLKAAEEELQRKFVIDLHSDGTEEYQIGGLQMILPTNPASGSYGGISRVDWPKWRTGSYDANSAFAGITQVTKDTIKTIFDNITIDRSLGAKGPNLIACSKEHYLAYTASLVNIQRINDETKLGKMGFQNLRYYGAGKAIDVVLEGGIGTAMPANRTYFLDVSGALKFRYHPDRNFTQFGGKQSPINQDAIVQYIGFMGNFTNNNPLHEALLYDSNTSA